MAFFESHSFEDAIRNVVSIGGDTDTIAAIYGGVAEAYYGILPEIADQAVEYLDRQLTDKFLTFCKQFGMTYTFTKWKDLDDAYQKRFVKESLKEWA